MNTAEILASRLRAAVGTIVDGVLIDEKLLERFCARVEIGDGCWVWTGSVIAYRSPKYRARPGYGHGVLSAGSHGRLYAHRLSWALHRGPIPDGLWVLHKCDVPPCVNPAHLFLGTCQDNIDDAIRKGRLTGLFRSLTHCHAGHPNTPENRYVRPDGTKPECAVCRKARYTARNRRLSERRRQL